MAFDDAAALTECHLQACPELHLDNAPGSIGDRPEICRKTPHLRQRHLCML